MPARGDDEDPRQLRRQTARSFQDAVGWCGRLLTELALDERGDRADAFRSTSGILNELLSALGWLAGQRDDEFAHESPYWSALTHVVQEAAVALEQIVSALEEEPPPSLAQIDVQLNSILNHTEDLLK